MSEDIESIEAMRAEIKRLRADCIEAVAMLQDVATLDCGPDQALHWWSRRGELVAKYLVDYSLN